MLVTAPLVLIACATALVPARGLPFHEVKVRSTSAEAAATAAPSDSATPEAAPPSDAQPPAGNQTADPNAPGAASTGSPTDSPTSADSPTPTDSPSPTDTTAAPDPAPATASPTPTDGAAPTDAQLPAPAADGAMQAQQAANTNCTVQVPRRPLTARGLATPYVLTGTGGGGACHEANPDQAAFVEATIVNPRTGALSIYRPLVVDEGTQPAAQPVVPRLPRRAVVGIWFGFNGDTLSLTGTGRSLAMGNCVNGLPGSNFGQFAYCNAPAFFEKARAAIRDNRLTVPRLGTGKDGLPCPTVRDFGVVDQDQSDNVTTTYLATGDGRTAQNTTATANDLAGASPLTNGSDNRLLDAFMDPAIGCQPFTAPDLTNNGVLSTSLALNELQAAKRQARPRALTPLNNPMTQRDGRQSKLKTNLYRAGVGQRLIGRGGGTGNPEKYCAHLADIGSRRLKADHDFFVQAPSPEAETNNLFDFLTQRLHGSLQMLGCAER